MIDPARTTLRALKGAPLSILIALFIEVSPLLKKRMEILTGYNSDSIQKGVDVLLALGLIAPSGNAWALTTAAWQLPLPFDVSKQGNFSTKPPVLFEEDAHLETLEMSPKKSDTTVPVVGVISLSNLTEILPPQHTDTRPKKSDSEVAAPEDSRDLEPYSGQSSATGKFHQDLVRVMRVFSIFPNVAKRLAERIVEGELQISPFQIIGLGNWLKQDPAVRNIGATLKWHIEEGTLPPKEYMPPVDDLDDALRWFANQQVGGRKVKSVDRDRYLKYLEDVEEDSSKSFEEDDL